MAKTVKKLLTKDYLESNAFISRFKSLEEASKEFTSLKADIKNSLFEIVGHKVENDFISMMVTEPTVAATLDQAKLKEEYPEIYKACLINQSKDGSLRITKK